MKRIQLAGVVIVVCIWISQPVEAVHKNVLAIGNSYSQGSFPQLISFVSADNTVTMTYVNATSGGKEWEWHYTNRFNSVYPGGSLSNLLRSVPIDYIVLQNFSIGMTKYRDIGVQFLYGSNLYQYCMGIVTNESNPNINTNVQVKLFMTWSRRSDETGILSSGYDRFDMQEEIRTNYNNLGNGLGCEVIPVGEAWERIYNVRPYESPEYYSIHNVDKTHGNDLGYYLNGAMFFEKLFGVNAGTASYIDPDVPTNEAVFLRDVAHQTLAEISLNSDLPPVIDITTNHISMNEGGSATFDVRLPAAPASETTVAIVRVTGNDINSLQSNGLVFTASNWDTRQTVTMTAPRDADQLGTTNIYRLSADSFYSPYLLAVVSDVSPSILLSTNPMTVAEGSSSSVQVTLSADPIYPSTVNVMRTSGDSDITVVNSSLIFTSSDWDTAQAVWLAAAEDSDSLYGQAIIRFSEDHMSSTELTVNENENDLGIVVNTNSLVLIEGSSGNIAVTLNGDPGSPFTVTVARVSGDSDVAITAGSLLVFTSADYMNWQTATVSSAHDVDQLNDSATLQCTGDGVDAVEISVTVDDDDYEQLFSGMLAAWQLDDISSSPVVTQTSAYFMATGLVSDTSAGVLTHSDLSKVFGASDAMKANDNDETNLADAITTGYYFYWRIKPLSNHVMTITQVLYRTECENTVVAALLSDASGLDAGSVLATNGPGANASMVDLSGGTNFVEQSDAVEFRVYGYAGESQYNALYFGDGWVNDGLDDIQIYGSVAYSAPGTTSLVINIQISTNTVTMNEGSNATFQVRLSDEPVDSTTVTVARASGDTDVTVSSGSALTFTSSDWDTWQTVTIAAAEDGDFTDDTAVIRCSADGMSDQDVSVTVTDNDIDPTYILPFSEPFEAGPTNAGGLGALNGQHGWGATGATVQGTTYYAGTQACSLASGGMTHTFTDAQTNVTVTFYAQPFFGQTNGAPAADDTAVFWFNTNGNVIAYSGAVAQVSSDPLSVMGWRKIEVALDYGAGQWDLTVDGTNVFSNLAFYSAQLAFAHLHIEQAATNLTFVDAIMISPIGQISPIDTDGDGMPDDWELTYSGTTTGFMPYADHDGDGMPNIHEFIANTVPTNSESLFIISDVAAETSAGNYVITWDSVSGRVYGISWGTNLLNSFNAMTSGIPALPPQNVYTDETHSIEQSGYYRIDVKMAE